MTVKPLHIALAGIGLAFLWYAGSFTDRLVAKLAQFIPSVEGFRSTPYWDETRYSWGYGTAAPGPNGTISREQAFADMVAYLLHDYSLLSAKITRHLNVNQWAALLSFAYNLGAGSGGAADLVPYINQEDDTGLSEHWMHYVHAGGVVDQNLVDRRQKELNLWFS